MKFLLLIAGLTLAGTAQAQNPQADEARVIMQLEADWGNALVNRDTVTFRRILAPGFIYTEDAAMMTRDQVIKGVMSGDKVERATNTNMRIHEFGPVAVVTGIFVVVTRGKSGPHTTRYRFTDVWLNTAGKWQAVAAQDHTIPDKPTK